MPSTLRSSSTTASAKRSANVNGKKLARRAVANGKHVNGKHAGTVVELAPQPVSTCDGLDKRQLYAALSALKEGNFSVRLPADLSGIDRSVAEAFNDVVELNQRMATELERVCRVVGKEGRISQRASVGHVTGAWAESVQSVN